MGKPAKVAQPVMSMHKTSRVVLLVDMVGHGRIPLVSKMDRKKNKKNAKKWELTLSRKTLAEPPPKDMIMSQISTLIRRITLG